MWRSKKFNYVSLEDAHQLIRKVMRQKKLKREVVSVFQAYNRVLAEDITSDVDIPPVSISHFDGYAVRAEDTSQASIDNPILLRVVGRSYLGEEYEGEVNIGEAAYISTGCKLPVGANAVIPVEMAKTKGDFIEVRHEVRLYENVIPIGMDIKKGEVIFEAGHALRAQDIKLLIDIKKWRVKVFKRPVVAILSVGNELTDQIEEAYMKKFNSHGPMVSILVEEAGGVPLNLGIAPDDVDAIEKLLREGMKKADIVATIGGASIGEKDYVWEAIKLLGASELMIRGIKVVPGRVTSLCMVRGKPIVMLPGHVQSTLVGFYFILLPLIWLMSGIQNAFMPITLKTKTSQEIVFKRFIPFKKVVFVKVAKTSEGYLAKPILGDSSLISVVTKANGFIVVPEGKKVVKKGEEADVQFLRGLFSAI